jgi:transposase-like protein
VTDKELDKNAARRLAIIRHALEVTGNVVLTCRYCGISRQVFYTWLRRYQAEGSPALTPMPRNWAVGVCVNWAERWKLSVSQPRRIAARQACSRIDAIKSSSS